MIEQAIKRIAHDLEILTKYGIKLERALDLLEAATNDLEEILAINTMRESLADTPVQTTEDYVVPVTQSTQVPEFLLA